MRVLSSAEHVFHIPVDDEGTRGCDRETVSLNGMSSSVSQPVSVIMGFFLSIPVSKRVGAKANGAPVRMKCGLVYISISGSFIVVQGRANALGKCGAMPYIDFAEARHFLYQDLSCRRC